MDLPTRRTWQASADSTSSINAVINQGSRLALDLEGIRQGISARACTHGQRTASLCREWLTAPDEGRGPIQVAGEGWPW